MNTTNGYHLISPSALHWRPSHLMKIPNADYLERTGSEKLGARLWRLPPKSANTWHRHVRAEEFYFVVEGIGRLRVGTETLTVPRYGAVHVAPEMLRQVFNDTDAEVLWLIVGGPEELEFSQGSQAKIDLSRFYPEDPQQLPPELAGSVWPPLPSAPGPSATLRRPWEKLVGCLWLARLVDKTRLKQRGTLPADYLLPYCHPMATDGAFLAHFNLTQETLMQAVARTGDREDAFVDWFLAHPGVSAERIQAWNALAPHLGKPGYPVARGFQRMRQRQFSGQEEDPRVDCVFALIAFDEGYWAEWLQWAARGTTP